MSKKMSLEEIVQLNEKKIREIELQNEVIKQNLEKRILELQMTVDELKEYCKNPENFTPEIWKALEEYKQESDAKLERDLSQYANPLLTKKKRSELNLPSYALFVR